MNYKEKLTLYSLGELPPEEARRIREELDRFEAMEAFLLEEEEARLGGPESVASAEPWADAIPEALQVRQHVTKRLRRVVLSAVAITTALFLGVFFILSPLMDAMFYDPGRQSLSDRLPDLSYDIYALTELHRPGFTVSTGMVTPRQFGRYQVKYGYLDTFSKAYYSVDQSIVRGKITDVVSDPIFQDNHFMARRFPQDPANHAAYQEKVRETLERFNPLTYVSATLYFGEDLTMQQVTELEKKYPEITFQWAAIRTESPDAGQGRIVGIQLMDAKADGALLADEGISQDYPGFFIMEWLTQRGHQTEPGISLEAMAYEAHFKALLDYTADRSDELEILSQGMGLTDLEQARDYIEGEGIKTMGVLVYAEAEDLLELMDSEPIVQIDLNQTMVSKPLY